MAKLTVDVTPTPELQRTIDRYVEQVHSEVERRLKENLAGVVLGAFEWLIELGAEGYSATELTEMYLADVLPPDLRAQLKKPE